MQLSNRLFRSDKFDKKSFGLTEVPNMTYRTVSEFFNIHFLKANEQLISIKSVSELGVNSRNFILQTTEARYLLKLIESEERAEKTSAVSKILAQRILVPSVIYCEELNLLFDGAYYKVLILEYIEGVPFRLQNKELYIQIVKNLYSMSHALENMLPREILGQVDYNECIILESLSRFASKLSRPDIQIDQFSLDYFFDVQNDFLWLSSLDSVRKNAEKINPSNYSPVHIDLHPLNLIFDTDRLALIDLEAFSFYEKKIAYSFSVVKCFRTKLVETGMITPEVIDELRDIVFKSFGGELDIEDVLAYAQLEYARRASLIIRELENSGFSSWNGVLVIQINGVLESQYLIERIKNA